MEQTFADAIKLLIVGMLTVFVVLFLVILIGNTLIRIINRFMPEEAKKAANNVRTAVSSTSIDSQKMAVIASAVSIITNGKGKVENVEKI
jgi:oxaloacetate decarboxylase (Na+ extruding) subunit gamma